MKIAGRAKPEVYDPLKDVKRSVTDALNVGALQMNHKGEEAARKVIMDFVGRYNLSGFLTSPPAPPLQKLYFL